MMVTTKLIVMLWTGPTVSVVGAAMLIAQKSADHALEVISPQSAISLGLVISIVVGTAVITRDRGKVQSKLDEHGKVGERIAQTAMAMQRELQVMRSDHNRLKTRVAVLEHKVGVKYQEPREDRE